MKEAIISLGRASPRASSNLPVDIDAPDVRVADQPATLHLFGLAGGGVCHAVAVTRNAVRSYRTISPLPGGSDSPWRYLSVALSVGLLRLAVGKHRCPDQFGLSSSSAYAACAR